MQVGFPSSVEEISWSLNSKFTDPTYPAGSNLSDLVDAFAATAF